MDDEEKEQFLKAAPRAEPFVKPFISAHEFLHGKKRWCLWLVVAKPADIRSNAEIKHRIEAVKIHRSSSKRETTAKLADYPSLFGEIRQPKSDYLLIPCHSSESRRFIPMAMCSKDEIANNSCLVLPGVNLYQFGILMSSMHMAWTNQVCGRLEGRYRYSNNIVYNNYPWPEKVTAAQKSKVVSAAKKVLKARSMYSSSTLAELYDPNAMPKALVDAHKQLDAAVDNCYRPKPFKTEFERLEFLFDLYRRYTSPLMPSQRRIKTRRQTS